MAQLLTNTNPPTLTQEDVFSVVVLAVDEDIVSANNPLPVSANLQIANLNISFPNTQDVVVVSSANIVVDNFPVDPLSSITNSNPLPVSLQVVNAAFVLASPNVSVDNFPATSNVVILSGVPAGTNHIGSIDIDNFPSSFVLDAGSNQIGNVSITALPNITLNTASQVLASNTTTLISNTNPLPVSLQISNSVQTVEVSGNVLVGNFPTSLQISSVPNTVLYSNTTTPISSDNPLPVSFGTSLNANVTGSVAVSSLPFVTVLAAPNTVLYSNATTPISSENPLPVSASVSVVQGNTILYSDPETPISLSNPLPVSAVINLPNTVLYSSDTTPITNSNPLPVYLRGGFPTEIAVNNFCPHQIMANSSTLVNNANPFPVSIQMANTIQSVGLVFGLPQSSNNIGNVSITLLPPKKYVSGFNGFGVIPFTLMSSELDGLTINGSVTSSDTFSQVNYGSALKGKIYLTLGGAYTAGSGIIKGWFLFSPDGENFEAVPPARNSDFTLDCGTRSAGDIVVSDLINIPAWVHKVYIENTANTLPTGNVLKVAPIMTTG